MLIFVLNPIWSLQLSRMQSLISLIMMSTSNSTHFYLLMATHHALSDSPSTNRPMLAFHRASDIIILICTTIYSFYRTPDKSWSLPIHIFFTCLWETSPNRRLLSDSGVDLPSVDEQKIYSTQPSKSYWTFRSIVQREGSKVSSPSNLHCDKGGDASTKLRPWASQGKEQCFGWDR